MKGDMGGFSIWNKALSITEFQELASLMAFRNTENHSAYAANCIGYWKQYANKLINLKNSAYNGTYSGFTNP